MPRSTGMCSVSQGTGRSLDYMVIIEVLIILGTLPLSLVGGFWLLYWLDYNISGRGGGGLHCAGGCRCRDRRGHAGLSQSGLQTSGKPDTNHGRIPDRRNPARGGDRGCVVTRATDHDDRGRDHRWAVADHAGRWHGFGSDATHRRPMAGGMVSATVLTLVVIPAVFLLWKRRGL